MKINTFFQLDQVWGQLSQLGRWAWLGILLLVGCIQPITPTVPPLQPSSTAVPSTPLPTTAAETPTDTAVPPPTPDGASSFTGWPNPADPLPRFSREEVTEAQRETAVQLTKNDPPPRDDIQLAVDYAGIVAPSGEVPVVSAPLAVGTRQKLTINDIGTNERRTPDFELRHVSDHAYFWFDSTGGYPEPSSDALAAAGNAFDDIYEQVTQIFGPEDNPGVDGDPIIHIVNVSPQTLCGASSCGVLGYVDSSNFLPQTAVPTSNEREMFVMNASIFGETIYLDVLVHEFRHMIEDRYDINDQDWEVEGSAMLAEDLLGFSSDPVSRGNLFLTNPDQQLNRWTDGNSIPYYGQGYLLNRYIYNRLGGELYRDFATSPLPGLAAVDAVAAENNLGFTGLELWLDWLAALAIHVSPNAPERYALREGLNQVSMTAVSAFPFAEETTVSQFAADYYELQGEGIATLTFTGSNHVPLLTQPATSGQYMWVANRANNSQAMLMREFDLTAVSSATLTFDLYQDIEYAYDYAYLSISTDGGITWQGLTGANSQSRQAGDDPGQITHIPNFYTGQDVGWIQETADLTPYVGNTVLIRFEYLTDPILTFNGLAIDNIAIPEINFYDDAESDSGWQADGFVRATSSIPQQWHIQLIRFEKNTPLVATVPLSGDNTATIDIPVTNSGGGYPIIIISATAPMTLLPAHYELTIEK